MTAYHRQVHRKKAVLSAGLLCGVLDIAAAFLHHGLRGVSPVRILQAIASGLLGTSSFRGGAATAALGALLHFAIAFTAAAVYYAAARRMHWLLRHPVLAGLLYGSAVHLFMQFVVLPLSAVRSTPFQLDQFLIGLGIHMLFVGMPISHVVAYYYARERRMTKAASGGSS
jgi:hypothetical protein